MKICSISDKGSGIVYEDNTLVGDNIFGVFDGCTSLNGYTDAMGNTGGLLASSIAKEIFRKSQKLLKYGAIDANNAIKDRMISEGIDIRHKVNLWSTSAAVVRINKDSLEWLQIGDSLILVIYNDASYDVTVHDYDHDKETLIMWQELGQKKVINIREQLNEQIIKIRNGMNIHYGMLNGEAQMSNFLREGSMNLIDIKHILLFTDGFLLPKKDPRENDDFGMITALFLEGGLEKVRDHIRNIENQDSNCWTYPRFKKHDDIAAISITFNH